MKRLLALASALVLLAGGARAQELSLKGLDKDLNAVFAAANGAGKKGPDSAKVDELLSKYLDLATDKKGEDEGFDALNRVLQVSMYGSKEKLEKHYTEALDALVESWIDSDKMAWVVLGPLTRAPKEVEKVAKDYTEQIRKDSKSESVKLAFEYVAFDKEASTASTPDAIAKIVARGKELKKKLEAKLPELAQQLDETIAGFEIIGKPADEIEGKDLDGVAFKLSDYRGKVVLLDFWGYW